MTSLTDATAIAVRSRSPERAAVHVVDRSPPVPPPPKIDVGPLVRALESGLHALRAEVDAAFDEIERECVELALAAAEHVVHRRCERGELELEEPLRALLATRRRELLALPTTLRLHPEDAKVLAHRLTELAPAGAQIAVVSDAATPRGQLTLEIGAGRVVRSLGHELSQLRRHLLAGGGA